jgi:hypothetical protein
MDSKVNSLDEKELFSALSKVKVRVHSTTDHKGPEGSRDIALLFL